MTRTKGAARRPLISLDAKGYGSADGARQAGIQRGLLEVLDESAADAGLRRAEWIRQSGGDGELAILPPDEPEDVLVDNFLRELAVRLAEYNEDRVPAAHLRVRIAIHNGIAVPAASGYAGAGIVAVSRLVDSGPLRAAQSAAAAAGLVAIISNRVFLDTVAQRHTALRPNQFRRVQVQVKEYREEAWLYVPGHDVHALDLGGRHDRNRATESTDAMPATAGVNRTNGRARQAGSQKLADVVNEFHGQVSAEVIGIKTTGGDG